MASVASFVSLLASYHLLVSIATTVQGRCVHINRKGVSEACSTDISAALFFMWPTVWSFVFAGWMKSMGVGVCV